MLSLLSQHKLWERVSLPAFAGATPSGVSYFSPPPPVKLLLILQSPAESFLYQEAFSTCLPNAPPAAGILLGSGASLQAQARRRDKGGKGGARRSCSGHPTPKAGRPWAWPPRTPSPHPAVPESDCAFPPPPHSQTPPAAQLPSEPGSHDFLPACSDPPSGAGPQRTDSPRGTLEAGHPGWAQFGCHVAESESLRVPA